ncbi:MAG: HAD-IB family phosphatase [Gemmatimonadetes bacterium]|nr:HAD-IB family phosphatase [Gemmatimonadota bacterium]
MTPRYRSVVLDADSTLAAIEGIDWLGALRGPEVGAGIAAITRRAMDGEIPLEGAYVERLRLIGPTRAELDALGQAYVDAILPGAAAHVAAWRRVGVRCVIVSGGIRPALLPLADVLGIAHADVHAVEVTFDARGTVSGLAGSQPLATSHGKPQVVAELALARPSLAVGDGMTDARIRPVVDAFVAFTAVERRAAVVAAADHEVTSFDALARLVLA